MCVVPVGVSVNWVERWRRGIPLSDERGFKHWIETMLAQQLDELDDTALLIRAEVIMNVPAKVILPKTLREFCAALDDVIHRINSKVARRPELIAQFRRVDAAPHRPHRIDKRQLRQLSPRRTEVEDFMRRICEQKIQRGIADEQHEILLLCFSVTV